MPRQSSSAIPPKLRTVLMLIDGMQFDLILVTQFSFMVAFMGMVGGAFYATLIQAALPPERQTVAITSAVYCLMAAIMYGFINYKYGIGTGTLRSGDYPTALRYIDWLITTPLIVFKFPKLFSGDDAPAIAVIVIAADIIMIVFGFAGENVNQRSGRHNCHRLVDVRRWLFGMVIHHLHSLFIRDRSGLAETGPDSHCA